jgi:hypothetical protein
MPLSLLTNLFADILRLIDGNQIDIPGAERASIICAGAG